MRVETDYRALTRAGQDGLPLNLSGGVVAIGNFDGVHRGHKVLLAEGKALAGAMSAPLVALTFSPHPRRLFQPNLPPFQLTDAVLRAEYLVEAGAKGVVDMTFDGVLAQVTAADFVDHVLLHALQAKHVIVGNNFVFGKDRGGDTAFLQQRGLERGFGVTALPVVHEEGERLSSRAVRDAIEKGQLGVAERILGRPWIIRGKVARGDERGRTIGFPTANIVLGEFKLPKFGVYAVQITIEGQNETHNGVANIGVRPTFHGGAPLLEAHLFDFNDDLYGKILRVAVREFLRPEQKFMGLEDLKAQIVQDVTNAREILARLKQL